MSALVFDQYEWDFMLWVERPLCLVDELIKCRTLNIRFQIRVDGEDDRLSQWQDLFDFFVCHLRFSARLSAKNCSISIAIWILRMRAWRANWLKVIPIRSAAKFDFLRRSSVNRMLDGWSQYCLVLNECLLVWEWWMNVILYRRLEWLTVCDGCNFTERDEETGSFIWCSSCGRIISNLRYAQVEPSAFLSGLRSIQIIYSIGNERSEFSA